VTEESTSQDEEQSATSRLRRALAVIGPGVLVAATGVGAGDLATAAFTGSELGVTVLWAVILGAGLKLALTEGLTRFQLATGETLLEGAVRRLGRWVAWIFLPYLLLWSFFVGSALMSACGVTLVAIAPVLEPATGKIVFGAASSLVGLALISFGGFRVFERVMGLSIGLLFLVVLILAAHLWPGTGPVLRGLIPSGKDFGANLGWTVALIGGVGGTLTVLSYGYWIREEGRAGLEELPTCRLDLATGYAVTALFGLAMVVIGAAVELPRGGGAKLIVELGALLEAKLGATWRGVFLLGCFGAVFSSLLGVWQSVPYLFADFFGQIRGTAASGEAVDVSGRPYRAYLWGLALIPLAGLFLEFKAIQKLYAVIGACFLPLLAVTLLALNRERHVGQARNGPLATLALVATLSFFAFVAWRKLAG
jgi:Mn2+/Fe2+ NRAMP family transporter